MSSVRPPVNFTYVKILIIVDNNYFQAARERERIKRKMKVAVLTFLTLVLKSLLEQQLQSSFNDAI